MRKFTIFLLAMTIVTMAMAQSKFVRTKPQAVPLKNVKEQAGPAQLFNPNANTKAVLDEIIGATVYDMQTNASVDTRIRVFPDGTMGATWTRGTSNNSERGTGYNYFDGSAWGPAPTSRIENDRTGWPSYDRLGPNGEIVIAHLNDGLKVSTRPDKGTGAWSYNTIFGPAGATDISWPRIMTNGPNNNYIHMMIWTYVAYQNLDLALLYYRSLDGGATWDKTHEILPQLTSADYDGFNGDQVAWGTPHGDTIYFMVSGPWVDTFIMLSTNNGDTWTKIPILGNANKKLPAGTTDVMPFRASDGSCAVEMDKNGVFHAAFGVGGGYMEAGSKYIYINSNGLVYWNSTMPMVKDSLDLDTLEAHGNLLGAVYNGPNPGDTIIAAPNYRCGLSSQPQITVDDWNNVYFTWAACTPGNPSPDPYNYRHIWGRAKAHDKTEMSPQKDFNEGILYLFNEYVYPSMAKKLVDGNLPIICQTSSQPGSNIVSTTIPVHDCNIEYRGIPAADFWATGTGDKVAAKLNQAGQNVPNPASGTTRIGVTLARTAPVSLALYSLTGVMVMELNKGTLPEGSHVITLDASSLTPGVYFYTVTMGQDKVTRKMIVR